MYCVLRFNVLNFLYRLNRMKYFGIAEHIKRSYYQKKCEGPTQLSDSAPLTLRQASGTSSHPQAGT